MCEGDIGAARGDILALQVCHCVTGACIWTWLSSMKGVGMGCL